MYSGFYIFTYISYFVSSFSCFLFLKFLILVKVLLNILTQVVSPSTALYVVSKKFCLFTSIGFEIFDFDDFVDLNIKKDSETTNSFNWGGAIAGMIVGGGTGASYWAKDSKRRCKDLELSIICTNEFLGETTTDYCLVRGCEVDESSETFKAIDYFVYNIKRACEIIEQRK